MTRRTEQVTSLIQQELGRLMLELELPAMTTISRVDVTQDLKHAKIWITVFSEDKVIEESVLEELGKHMYELQGQLNRSFTMHHTPRIAFAIDNSQHYASRINELLRRTKDEEQ
ncbi:MAG: 30S ribosome-binding factor RbfA [Candidatus Doudnabacteria bacterium]|nr:30S ribosome-binding factor RbfA [Candidatus Doudnabacteria bacterium]